MSSHNHAVVWIDHRVAKIFFFGLNEVDTQSIEAHLASGHLHHRANTIGSGKVHDDPAFFRRIDEALNDSEAILVVGPGSEKTLLQKYLAQGYRSTKERSIEVKPCDHPTDREVIAMGRQHFHLGEPTR